jgi:hypothetical protein
MSEDCGGVGNTPALYSVCHIFDSRFGEVDYPDSQFLCFSLALSSKFAGGALNIILLRAAS